MDIHESAQRVRDILEDPEWTQNVVMAAVVSLRILDGPPITPDGDRKEMVARSTLNTAITDLRGIFALQDLPRPQLDGEDL